jgi:beta-fructofuranosidase
MHPISRRRFLAQASIAATAALLPPAALATKELRLDARLASDPRRPQYHLLPAANWMNDPNGPIFYQGRYHMFFQYNPNGAYWGDMHWAHATSPDMIRWVHERVAIAPTPDGYDRNGAFSGSVVLDGTTPTAIYTGVLPPSLPAEITLDDGNHKWREVQCLATSTDPHLRTWQKLPYPIIVRPPEGLSVTGFRDPGVWREGDDWLLTLGAGIKGTGGLVLLYKSTDLRTWEYLHPLVAGAGTGQPASNPCDNGEMWECPDFFPLGDRHVLIYSTIGKVRWKTGTYKDRRFTAEKEGIVDGGSYYAAKSMLDASNTRILWGWIPETRPEAEYKAAGWAGLMSLPRVLSIGSDGGLEMKVAPVAQTLRGKNTQVRPGLASQKQKALQALRIHNLAAEIEAEFMPGQGFQLKLISERKQLFAEIAYDPTQRGKELRINAVTSALDTNDSISLHLFLDGSSLEVFANRKAAVTARIYAVPSGPLRVEVANLDGLRQLQAWGITPISHDRLATPPEP